MAPPAEGAPGRSVPRSGSELDVRRGSEGAPLAARSRAGGEPRLYADFEQRPGFERPERAWSASGVKPRLRLRLSRVKRVWRVLTIGEPS